MIKIHKSVWPHVVRQIADYAGQDWSHDPGAGKPGAEGQNVFRSVTADIK